MRSSYCHCQGTKNGWFIDIRAPFTLKPFISFLFAYTSKSSQAIIFTSSHTFISFFSHSLVLNHVNFGFSGDITQVAMFDRALSSDEINQIYDYGLASDQSATTTRRRIATF